MYICIHTCIWHGKGFSHGTSANTRLWPVILYACCAGKFPPPDAHTVLHACLLTFDFSFSLFPFPLLSVSLLFVCSLCLIYLREKTWPWVVGICWMIHSYVWHDAFVCVAWVICRCNTSFIRTCDRAPAYTYSFVRATWGIRACDMAHSNAWLDSCVYVTCFILMRDIDDLEVWHDTLHKCDMSHSYVRRVLFTCMRWLVSMCDMTHPYVWHHLFVRVAWFIWRCDMTY